MYIELAELARSRNGFKEASRVIDDGLKVLPLDPLLHLEKATVEMSGPAGSNDKAITSLRRSLELLPDDPQLHWMLANLLAQPDKNRADLLTQIGELKRLNASPVMTGLLEAKSMIIDKDWIKARLLLIRLQQNNLPEMLKAQVQDLLALCYHQLGERDREVDEYKKSIRVNPKDVQAQVGLAMNLLARNDIDAVLNIYRDLVKQLSLDRREAELRDVCGRLVHLLIARSQQCAADSLTGMSWTS